MKLLETLPQGYGAHNTGGEHTSKHSNDPADVDKLRQKYLEPTPPAWDIDAMHSLMRSGDEGELVSVSLEDGPADDHVIAGGLTRYEYHEGQPYESTARLTDLVVAEEHRGKGIASFILGKIWMRRPALAHSIGYPSNFVFDTTTHELPEWLPPKLGELGFAPDCANDELTLRLPGSRIYKVIKNKDDHEKAMEGMPEGWNGVWPVLNDLDEEDLTVYQKGIYVGAVRNVGDGIHYDEDEHGWEKFMLVGVDGETKTDSYANEMFAVVDLINQPDLRQLVDETPKTT